MSTHGFTLIRSEPIAELKAQADLYRHDKSGAELLSIRCDDENKVFGITFRTPPADSTGVAHILEHSVLCGSRKYPVKEPFVELLKGSLQTFLNAFTYPDKTCYPVASQNLKDFYNLVDVYLDAVLYPLLTRHTHAQEAWHYEMEKADGPLVFKGVVFNEMKGVYSSPDSALAQWGQESVFPDITYGLDYGGNPRHIPDLTYDGLTGFHKRYYHPSNSRIWFYGDDDPTERLRLLNEWLTPFDRQDVASAIPLQRTFDAPRRSTREYHATDATAKSFFVQSWLLPETTDVKAFLAFEILSHILIGTPASPLRKALIESGLGEDLAGIGLENQLRQMYLSTGLKGIAANDADKVAALVESTLRALVDQGIDRKTVDAALNTIEFRLRENNTGNYPRGLALMVRTLAIWLYDGDPYAALRFEEPLKAIRSEASKGLFEGLIRQHMLENPHRADLLLVPSSEVGPKLEADEKARLDAKRASLSQAEREALVAETETLKRMQGAPDSPEALAKLPKLTKKDLNPTIRTIPCVEQTVHNTRVLYHDLFTQGIAYVDLGFNLQVLPQKLLSYVPLYGRALLEMGTQREDFVSLSQRIGTDTGGISPTSYTSGIKASPDGVAYLFLRAKAMTVQSGKLFEILSDVLLQPRFDNQERFRQIVLEEKATFEGNLIPIGHSVVHHRLKASFHAAEAATEALRGVSYLLFLRALAERIDKDWNSVRSELETVHRLLVSRSTMILNATMDAASWATVSKDATAFLHRLPDAPVRTEAWEPMRGAPPAEGLALPAQVNYVGLGGRAFGAGVPFKGSALVVSRYLRTAYLWDHVRVQGGAYGGFAYFDYRTGILNMVSYRDPNFQKTLDIYRATPKYLRALKLSDDELTKAVVGAIGDLDAYQLPDAKGFTSMTRMLCGDDDRFRQRMRDEVLATSHADFADFAGRVEAMLKDSKTVVLGHEESLRERSDFTTTKIL